MTVLFYTAQNGKDYFDEWIRSLDKNTRGSVLGKVEEMQKGLSNSSKGVAKRVWELIIGHGPGYRVYFTKDRGDLLIVLSGGIKKTQKKDIRFAESLAREYHVSKKEKT